MALEVCNRISKEPSRPAKSIFWVDSSSRLTIDADLQRISSEVGLHRDLSGDLSCLVIDFLKSRYSGDWVLVFDNITNGSIFLEFFTPINPYRHTPGRRRLVDMIPSKPYCNVLFLAHQASCLEAIFNGTTSKVLQLPSLTIEDGVHVIDEMQGQSQSADGSTKILDSTKTTISRLFGHNLGCLVQVVKHVNRRPEILEALESQGQTLPVDESRVSSGSHFTAGMAPITLLTIGL